MFPEVSTIEFIPVSPPEDAQFEISSPSKGRRLSFTLSFLDYYIRDSNFRYTGPLVNLTLHTCQSGSPSVFRYVVCHFLVCGSIVRSRHMDLSLVLSL